MTLLSSTCRSISRASRRPSSRLLLRNLLLTGCQTTVLVTQLLHATSVMAGNSAATMSAVFLVTIADAVMMQPIGGGLGVGGAAVRTICDRIE